MARPPDSICLRLWVLCLALLGGTAWGAPAVRDEGPAAHSIDGRTALVGGLAALVGWVLWGTSRARTRRAGLSHSTGGGSLRAIRLDSESIDAFLGRSPAELPAPPVLTDSSQPTPSASPLSLGTAISRAHGGNAAAALHRPARAAKPSVACRARPAFSLEDRVYTLHPEQVVSLLEAIFRKGGHEVERPEATGALGKTMDLLLSKDSDRTAVNCRHWKDARIGTPVVEGLAEAMRTQGIGSGMILSLKGYTFQARTQAQAQGIRILDRPEILQLLEEAEVSIDPALVEIVAGTPAPAST